MFSRKFMLFVVLTLLLASVSVSEGQSSPELDFEIVGPDPVITSSGEEGTWDHTFAFAPSIVEHDDTYYMFYTGYDGTGRRGAINIGYAMSSDGINWQQSDVNPLISPVRIRQMSYPLAYLDADGTWVLLFNDVSLRDGYPSSTIYRATAPEPDGPWDVESAPVIWSFSTRWDAKITMRGIINVDGEYRLYYVGLTSAYEMPQIGVITSEDGDAWTFYDDPATTDPLYDGSDPILTAGDEGDWDGFGVTTSNVVATEEGFELFYAGFDNPITTPHAEDETDIWLGYATSTDGFSWTKDARGPLIETQQPGWIFHFVQKIDDVYHIYFDTSRPAIGIGLTRGTITQ